jgi:DinB family protein
MPALSAEQYAALPRRLRIERLARTADQLRAAIEPATIPRSAERVASLIRRPAPGAWAPVEVVCHLRDTEEWFLTRCRWALLMDEPAFPRNNPDRWAVERQYLRNDPAQALDAFRAWRKESLEFFSSLSGPAWTRGGRHLDGRGRRTIGEFLSIMAWHDDNHLDQLTRALAGRP